LGGPLAASEALQPAPFHARFTLTERAQAPKPIRSKRCTRRGSAGGNALRAGVLGVILTAALGLAAAAAHAQTLVPTEWCTDGDLFAVARSGNTIYIGGVFTTVGPSTGGGVPLDGTTGLGAVGADYPKVLGTVYTGTP